MKPRTGKQTAEAAGRTRAAILEAASREFAARGFDGASLREIGAAASTTHGLIRHHFGTKEELWRATIDHLVTELEQRHAPLLAKFGDSDPIELLKGFVTHFVQVSAELPAMSKVIMNDCSSRGPRLDYLVERMTPIHKAIEPVFLAVQAQGELRHHDADTFFIFVLTLGSFPFALAGFTDEFYHQKISSRAGIRRHTELVLQTLFES